MESLLNEGVAVSTEETLVPPDEWSVRFQRYQEFGDQDAFRELYDHFYHFIFVIAAHFFHDHHTAEDVMHEVWIKLLHNHTFDPHKPFKPWLNKAIHHQCIDHQRRSDRRTEGHETAIEFDLPDHHDDLDIALVTAETRQVLDAIPPLQKEALQLHFFDDLNVADMARHCGISDATMSWRYKGGIQKFRRAYEVLLSCGHIPHQLITHE